MNSEQYDLLAKQLETEFNKVKGTPYIFKVPSSTECSTKYLLDLSSEYLPCFFMAEKYRGDICISSRFISGEDVLELGVEATVKLSLNAPTSQSTPSPSD